MDIKFDKDYLRELFYHGVANDKKHRYQPDIIRRYVRVVNICRIIIRNKEVCNYGKLRLWSFGYSSW